MKYRVELQPSGNTFDVAEGERVLNAGLAAGYQLPYSCRLGTCRTCRARITSGEVDYGDYLESMLPAEMRAKGYALLCQAKPLTDLQIEVHELEFEAQQPRIIPCRVRRIERPAPDVAVIDLRLPQNEEFRHVAGQYIDILLPDGKRRAYSIASMPSVHGVIDVTLHVRHTPGGLFTDRVFSSLKERELLRFEGPLGTFCLREDSDKPIIFLASGTGFAPIKAIVEYAMSTKIARPITLYWGGRRPVDLYMRALAEGWAADHPQFRFVPVISEARREDRWTGRTGLVHRAVMADFPNLSGYQVYASGNPNMVDAARDEFSRLNGLPEDEFFADAFVTEWDRAKPPASKAAAQS
jgi:CDP-4-dehydro-6-deoxyglucose reductase